MYININTLLLYIYSIPKHHKSTIWTQSGPILLQFCPPQKSMGAPLDFSASSRSSREFANGLLAAVALNAPVRAVASKERQSVTNAGSLGR